MNQLYPLKFKPILKQRIWGGTKLKNVLNKKVTKGVCGESWEISAVDGDVSVVENGFLEDNNIQELIEVYMDDLVGEKVYSQFGYDFPLLVKFIDANSDLSVQVHPDDVLAEKRHNSKGKTEMWYVMEAEPGASLISGFKSKVSKDDYTRHIENNSIEQVLNKYTVNKGDAFFIPAGQIHAIGAGLLIAEIQQSSDITYRIYDYNRLDDKGKPRELHTDQAVDAINFSGSSDNRMAYAESKNESVKLASCPFFTTNKLVFDKPLIREYISLDSFVIYICCEGSAEILTSDNDVVSIKKGETVLIPAAIKDVQLRPITETSLLEVYM